MIIQLPNGRIVEISIEQYLSMSDEEIQDLNGLSMNHTKEIGNPFYNPYNSSISENIDDLEDYYIIEKEPELHEIEEIDKLADLDFLRDDV
jgi:hypothetical protein